jgi:Uma2 family endonuclease
MTEAGPRAGLGSLDRKSLMATVIEPTDVETAAEECPRPYLIDVATYDRMIEAGVFPPDSRLYLWEGQLVLPMTKGEDHEYAVAALTELIVRLLPPGWHVRPSSPVRVGDYSVPEPDFLVLRGANREYRKRRPLTRDTSLAIEVSHSSLKLDAGEKLRGYASDSLATYWVVNIPNQRIEVHTRPSGPAEIPSYGECVRYELDDVVPVILDGREVGRIVVKDVLP